VPKVMEKREFGEEYVPITDVSFTAKYRASRFCNAVEYEVKILIFYFEKQTFGTLQSPQMLIILQFDEAYKTERICI
jgi:hypothetical protein